MFSEFDLNVVLVPLAYLSGALALVSGGFLLVKTFLLVRFEVAQSLNLDLEVVQVSKKKVADGAQHTPEEWREEIRAMEQLLTSHRFRDRESIIAGGDIFLFVCAQALSRKRREADP